MGKSTWTQEEIDTMLKGVEDGLSAGEVGRKIGKTRNSVLGKLHRMGLGFKHGIKKIKINPVKEKTQRRIGQIELKDIQPNQCRFMGGGYEDKLCCGECIYRMSFCEKHYYISISNPQPKTMKMPKREKVDVWEREL